MYDIATKQNTTITGYRCLELVETRFLSRPWTLSATCALANDTDSYPNVGSEVWCDGLAYTVTSVNRTTNESEHWAHITAIRSAHLPLLYAPAPKNTSSTNTNVTKLMYNFSVTDTGHVFAQSTTLADLVDFLAGYATITVSVPAALAQRPLGIPLPVFVPLVQTLSAVCELLGVRCVYHANGVEIAPVPAAAGTLLLDGPVLSSSLSLDAASFGKRVLTIEKKIVVTSFDGYFDNDPASDLIPDSELLSWSWKPGVTLPVPPSPIPITLATPEPYLPVSGYPPGRTGQQWLVFAQRSDDTLWEQLSVTVLAAQTGLRIQGLPSDAAQRYLRLRIVGAWSVWGIEHDELITVWGSTLSNQLVTYALSPSDTILISSLTPYGVTNGHLQTWGAHVLSIGSSPRTQWRQPHLTGSVVYAGPRTVSLGQRYASVTWTRISASSSVVNDQIDAPTTVVGVERTFRSGQVLTRILLGDL